MNLFNKFQMDLSIGFDNRSSKLNQFYLGFIKLHTNDKDHIRFLTPIFQLDLMKINRGLLK